MLTQDQIDLLWDNFNKDQYCIAILDLYYNGIVTREEKDAWMYEITDNYYGIKYSEAVFTLTCFLLLDAGETLPA